MKKTLQFLLPLLLIVFHTIAQDRTISGIVTSKEGNSPMPGVIVHIKGTALGTSTDQSGKFTLKLTKNEVLVFSFVGYIEQQISTNNRTSFNVSLETDRRALEEVVVVGYGTRQIKDLTGSVGVIKGNKLAAEANVSFDQALSGKLAGVQVTSSGGLLGDGISVRVRGVNSISGSALPLFVIDGVPMIPEENLNLMNSGNGTRFNPLSMMNPNDIQSIDVLKDAAAAVLYGSRAANGVVLITTKKGKQGTAKISFDSKVNWSQATKLPSLLNAQQFTMINNEKIANAANKFGNNVIIAKDTDLDGDGKPDETNWMKALYRTGFAHDNAVSLSGGSEKATYYASARYVDQQGIVFGNQMKTGQVRVNMDVTPTKWLKAGINVGYAKTFNKGVLSDRYLAGVGVSGMNAFPNVALYDPNNTTGFNLTSNGLLGLGNNVTTVNGTKLVSNNISNVYAGIAMQRNENTPQNMTGNAYMEVSPVSGLKLTTKIGVNYLSNFEDQYSSPYINGLGSAYNGMVQDYFRTNNQWVWQNFATYDRTFADAHRVSLTVGEESQFNKEQQTFAGGNDFADPFYQTLIDNTYTGIIGGETSLWSGGDLKSWGIQSYFGRIGYTFRNRYMIEGAYRTDAYSGFGIDSRWGKFPSISAGWVVSEENFMKSIPVISYLKIRGSYGRVGNMNGIDPYASRTLYGGGLYASQNGFATSQAGISTLKWETSQKTDVALDIHLFKDRIGIVAEYFKNNINGLLLDAPVLYTVGIPNASVYTNIGAMSNNGFEFTVNATVLSLKNFNWTSSLNFTAIKNNIKALVNNSDLLDPNFNPGRASVGKPLGEYKLVRWAGVDPANGNSRFLTSDGNVKSYDPVAQKWYDAEGKVTTAIGGGDAVYTGKTGMPKYYGGWDNNFSYKNFELGISLVYTGGYYIYNSTRAGMLSNSFQNNLTEILDRWTSAGQNTNVPKLYMMDNTGNQTSTRFLEKGDFLRARTISLGYTFRQPVFTRLGFNNLKVYGQVYNAFTITGYSGIDPEVNYNRNNTNIATAVDSRGVPQPKTYTLGLNVGF
ncbi:TonB-dependent receptor [Chitinophaga silvatica]|uniref:TonB-dependent receptor n=1 Tax=Chitinophaga silvatica TaxID=2282649 RepID=A0A3E1Y2D1_9BACT|nr:TonB-dependent receptor [Chitinophaga silvatica]RFS18687.1 TonB-dependent receptor [Chitinophaga silvatica]